MSSGGFSVFGPGIVYVTRADIVNPTPVNIGYAQDLSLDFSGNSKELFGQNQLPLDVARGTVKVTGKIKAAVISGQAWNTVFFGQAFTTGGIKWSPSEVGTIPSTPFQVTVVQSALFDKDLGVVATTGPLIGMPFTRVASAPTTGQYAVTAGVYTFAAADTGVGVKITYTYTTTSGQQLVISNQSLGNTPIFSLDYYTTHSTNPFVVRLYQCVANKLSMAMKLEDYMMPDFDFGAFTNAADNLGTFVYPDIS